MSKTIYIVKGEHSDYEGSYSWNVKAFQDKDSAEIFAMLLNEELKSLLKKHREIREKYEIEIKSQYDPEMEFDTGVGYEIDEIELEA